MEQQAEEKKKRFIDNTLSELDKANKSPIFGYQHLLVLPLEQAIETIIPLVPGLAEYAAQAKQLCNRESPLLSWDESAAIYLYSMPISFFALLNENLRAENRHALKPWFSFLKLFMTALEKLPSLTAVVWRGISSNISSNFRENTSLTWWSVNSCSTALNVVQLYLGDEGTVLCIHAYNGKDISAFSTFPDEHEIIIMPETRLHVKPNLLNFQDRLFIVHLEEE